jgi:hypothetical protein
MKKIVTWLLVFLAIVFLPSFLVFVIWLGVFMGFDFFGVVHSIGFITLTLVCVFLGLVIGVSGYLTSE